MKITKTASGKKTIKMSKSEWKAIGKKAGWMKESLGPKAPSENQYGHGLNEEAMKLLSHYGINSTDLFRYDDPSTGFKDIYEGIQAAKAGNVEALKQALEGRFGKKNIFQKKLF